MKSIPIDPELLNGINLDLLDGMEQGRSMSIDYTRPIESYGTAQQIVDHIQSSYDPRHIYTDSLNVNGRCVQDAMEKYLAAKAYGSSSLKKARISPVDLFFYIEEQWKIALDELQGKKPAFELGTFLHMAILEPTRFSRVVVEPKVNGATKDGVIEQVTFWKKQYETNEAIEDPDTSLLALADSVSGDWKIAELRQLRDDMQAKSGLESVSKEHSIAIRAAKYHYFRYGGGILPMLVKHSKREISIYATDPVTGLDVKIRPDALQFEENIGVNAIISLKSTRATNLSKFFYDSAKLEYDLTEGFYQDVASLATGRDFNTTITIMFQTSAPYQVAAFVWPGEELEWGKYKYRNALQVAQECREKDNYPGFDAFAEEGHSGLMEIELPWWSKRPDQNILIQ